MVNLEKKGDRIKVLFSHTAELLKTPISVSNRMLDSNEVVTDAIWDTGSQFSIMSRRLAGSLQLEMKDDGYVSGVGHSDHVKSALAVAFPGNSDWYTFIRPKVIDEIALGVDFIIGMDIIRRGNLSLSKENEGMLMEFVFDSRYFVNVTTDSVKMAYDKYNNVFTHFISKGL